MNYKYITKWISILAMASAVHAQKSNVVDSLLQDLANAEEDTARVRLMNELALSVFKSNQDSAFLWLEPAISLAEEIQDSAGLFEVWDTKGRVFERMGKLDSAIYFLKRAESIASMLGDKRRQARSFYFIGRTYRKLNKKRLAISSLNTSLALSTDIKDKSLQFAAVNILGTVYSSMAIYDTSKMYSLRALELQYELGNKIYQAGILRNLGNNASRANKLEKALDYFEQGIAIMEETADKRQQAI
jgi:tetratricopeptide (TPR) repeat protein